MRQTCPFFGTLPATTRGETDKIFFRYGIVGCNAELLLVTAVATTDIVAFPARIPVYLVALAVLRVGVLRFRTDGDGEAATREGRTHLGFAIVTFSLTYMAISAAPPIVAEVAGPAYSTAMAALSWIAAISLAGIVATMLPGLRGAFGLVERVFLLSTACWLLRPSILLAGPES